MSESAREMEGRDSSLGESIGIGSVMEQQADDLVVAVPRCEVKGSQTTL